MNSYPPFHRRRSHRGIRLAAVFLLAGAIAAVQAAPWRFAVMGDTRGNDESPGVNTQVLARIAKDIASSDCRFVLVTGDLIQGQGDIQSQFAAWTNTMAPIYRAGIPVYPVRGNHDCTQDLTGSVWRTVFPALPTNGPAGEIGLTYSFAFSNAFCVALDQYVHPHRINQAWLDAQFKDNTQPNIFVYGHEPAFRVYHSDCLAVYAAERNAFWNSLRRAGGRIYFCGHDHLYNNAAVIEGARLPVFQIVVGCGGAPFHAWKGKYYDARVHEQFGNTTLFGYSIVTVGPRMIAMEWKAILPDGRWEVLDSLMIEHPVRTPPTPP